MDKALSMNWGGEIMKEERSSYQLIIIALLVVVVLLVGTIVILSVNMSKTIPTSVPSENTESTGSNLNDNKQPTADEPELSNSNITSNENSNVNSTTNYITRDKAIEIALNHAKLKQSEVRDLDADLEKKYNTTVYEVDFEYKNYDYEYYIDAEKGTIVHSFKEIDH